MTGRFLAICAGGAVAAAMCGTAAADELIGTHGSWHAQTFDDGGAKGCTMWSKPTKEEGDYEDRGDVFVYVTHRPGKDYENVVSFTMGYPLKEDSEPSARIDGQKYALFADGNVAWSEDDEALVQAMRRGNSLVVQGVSTRGTLTTDTYSLSGATAAHNAINKACDIN